MTRTLSRMALAMALFASLTCGGDGGTGPTGGPDPGPVDLVLATPNSNDGALLLTVTGAVVTSVTEQGFEVVSAATNSSSVKLLVRGSIGNGVIARITVPDRNKLSSYQVTVNQAAARATYQQLPLTGYTVRLAPVSP